MHLCQALLAELEPNGRALHELFDGCEGPHMQRLMRFARLGLVEIDATDRVLLTECGRRIHAALPAGETTGFCDETEELNAFERAVGRLIEPPLVRLQRSVAA